MQISNLTACSNNLYPIIKKEMPTLANVVFWIFYIHKDYKRVKDANLLKEPQRIQKKMDCPTQSRRGWIKVV